ncbi:MAG: hypothetical protein AVDCRST_MAG56-7708 [uncultured Cytophagales bacterium]|uniref:Uncharacterized protein n=1 Tax=uncultured Cytophagales bacterium TaxID=158755 RepID=A0A6J4LPQ4_9SPHI|nr:MAG: hypothetical protein AVDCRST_MAG56-7708 [uncultured Cytophagales bacterium]
MTYCVMTWGTGGVKRRAALTNPADSLRRE